MKNVRKGLWAGILVGLSVVGFSAGAAIAQAPQIFAPAGLSSEGSVPAPEPTYAVNESGLTYGSALNATSPDNEPDLIQAVATNGLEGYVLKTDLDQANGAAAAAQFRSPEEALRWQEENRDKVRSVPVYDQEGRTVIGEFQIAYQVPADSVER